MLGKRMMAMCRTSIASRDPQGQEVMRQTGVAFDRANLSKEGCQRIIERGGELQAGIIKLLEELALPVRFAEEERASSYTYPPEYAGPKPITDQIDFLANVLGLDPTGALECAKNLPAPPDGDAEGWFAIPSVDALAKKHFPEVTDPAQMYCQAVQLVHTRVAASRLFYNYREGQITPAQLRLSDRTALALNLVAEVQKSGILIVGAQLGLRHRGRSVRRAREVFVGSEFGLGSLAVGSIVLTHPEWLVRWEQLQIDCAGDEFQEADGESYAPYFNFSGGRVWFGAHWVDRPHERYGSASGFLPQCLDT